MRQGTFRPVSDYSKSSNTNNNNNRNQVASSLLSASYLDKENTENLIINYNNMTTLKAEKLPQPVEQQQQEVNRTKLKEVALLCENLSASIDETFLHQSGVPLESPPMGGIYSASVDYFGSNAANSRPSISETAYLMKSFSIDEFNTVRNLSTSSNVSSPSTSQKLKKKPTLSLANPLAMKTDASKNRWNLLSPTDRSNPYANSPSNALKRKYKSRSTEEPFIIDEC